MGSREYNVIDWIKSPVKWAQKGNPHSTRFQLPFPSEDNKQGRIYSLWLTQFFPVIGLQVTQRTPRFLILYFPVFTI